MITSDQAKANGSCPSGSNNVEMIPRAGTRKKENTCYTCPSNCTWGGGCNDATTNQGVGPPNTPACKVGDFIYCMNCPFSSDNASKYAQCSNGVQYNDGVCTGWSGCAGSSLQGYANDGKTKKDWGWSADEINRITHSACLGSTEMGLNRPLPDGYSYDATGTCAVIPPRGRGTGKQTLKCPSGGTIDTVLFASYGLPRGSCKDISGGDFKIDPKCHDPNSQKIVEGQCLGKNSCTIDANTAYTDTCDKKDGSIFDGGFPRRLAVVVNCKNPTPIGESGPAAPLGESGPAAPPPPPRPPSPTSKYMGCYNNYPRKITGWDPDNLGNNPDRNAICKKKAVENNNKYYALENNNGCLVFNEDSYYQLAGPTTPSDWLWCSSDYGKDEVCCGQPDSKWYSKGKVHACPKEYPICTDYIANVNVGKCVAADGTSPKTKPPTTNNIEKFEQDCIGGGEVSVHKLEYPSELYSCNNYVCSKDPNGKYTTLEDCNDACKTKYTCDKNNWEIKKDMNGEYSTLHEASINCQKPPPRYSCNKSTWEIEKDKNGEYATAKEAALNCKRPFIIPKQNVTQEMVNNENKITTNIDGQIESRSNKLQSSYLRMIVWGAITILVVFMLFYYSTHRSDGILKTLITILICVVIIWVVASWFYNYFYRNSISFFSTPQMF